MKIDTTLPTSIAAPDGQTKRHEIEGPYSIVLVSMDDYGYFDYINDVCYVMDDFGTATVCPWNVYFH